MLMYVFLFLWIINAVIYIRLRLLIKKVYPKIHDDIFGKTLADHSVSTSIEFIKFSFGGKWWADITDPKVIELLKINRFFNSIMYLFVFGSVAYFLFATTQEVYFK